MPYIKQFFLLFTTLALGLVVFQKPASSAEKPLRVCLISGSGEYKSNKTLAAYQEYLESNYPVQCSRAFWASIDNLPGLENLDNCDVMLLFTRRLELKGEQLQRIKEYCLSGKPIVAVRTASHGIQSWLAFDREVLGGNYQGHYGSELPTKVQIVANAREHPILKGVNPFVSHASLYKNHGHARNLYILLTGNNTIETEPIAWTRKHKNGRLFYTSLGHPDDFEQESFRRLVANGLFWTSGREVPVHRNR